MKNEYGHDDGSVDNANNDGRTDDVFSDFLSSTDDENEFAHEEMINDCKCFTDYDDVYFAFDTADEEKSFNQVMTERQRELTRQADELLKASKDTLH
jgi:hypothetical protein